MKKNIFNDMTHMWHQRGQFEHKFEKVVKCYNFFLNGHFDPKLLNMCLNYVTLGDLSFITFHFLLFILKIWLT